MISVSMPLYILPDNPNNIFVGDLHVSDDQDMDSAIFNDSIDAMGLYQHVQFQTHRSGNILDLLLSDITQSTGLLTVAVDHISLTTELS